jgi:opacity protein-like surface antigen
MARRLGSCRHRERRRPDADRTNHANGQNLVVPPCRAGAPGDTRIRGNHRRPGDASSTHNVFHGAGRRVDCGAGVSAGYIGDWVGFEFDVERHGHFFKDAEIGNTGTALTEDVNTRATRIMGNVLVPLHRKSATGWRLYGAAGLGLVRADFIHLGQSPDVVRADSSNEGPREIHQNDFAFNAGGGVIKSLNSRLGLRADLRYFRAFADQNKSLPAGQIGDVNGVYRDYGFWQVTFGVTFRFPRER